MAPSSHSDLQAESSLSAFTKMHGLGNDFMVIDNRLRDAVLGTDRIQRLADRHTGVGFDQLLVVEPASTPGSEFTYRIFNADGSEVEHCGNGARCFARFVIDRGLTRSQRIPVDTTVGQIVLEVQATGDVRVEMGVPAFEPGKVPFLAEATRTHYDLSVGGQCHEVGVCAIGNPHVVLCVDNLDTAPVAELGPLIESHKRFPRRVNVGFAQIISPDHLRLRVYERGVGETRACGSGACAAVAVLHRQGRVNAACRVSLPGGDLSIDWPSVTTTIALTGPCSTVFEGQTDL